MLSNRPYLLRAFYQWIVDSACTPILILDADHPHCKIPQNYIENGEIVFNISSAAVRDLKITNDSIEFKASFSGVVHIISAPVKAILSIYAEENGEGIFFDSEEEGDTGNGVVQLKKGTSNVSSVAEQSLEGESSPIDSPQTSVKETVKANPMLRLIE